MTDSPPSGQADRYARAEVTGVSAKVVSEVLVDEAERLGIFLDATPHGAKAAPAPRPVLGLALSGGGIRSATFALGVLQALAETKRLASFDYLSTVSGGGYIGSWLSAWIHRTNLGHVQERLGHTDASGGMGTYPEPKEVAWLRRYSNYLTPRLGLLSTDTLVLLATWLRNVALNLVVIVAAVTVLLLAARELLNLVVIVRPHYAAFGFLGMGFLLIALLAIAVNFTRAQRTFSPAFEWLFQSHGIVLLVLMPTVLAALCGSLWLAGVPLFQRGYLVASALIVAVLVVGLYLAWLAILLKGRCRDAQGRWRLRLVPSELRSLRAAPFTYAAASIVAFGSLFLLAYAVQQFLYRDGGDDARLPAPLHPDKSLIELLTLGPPTLLVAMGIGTSLFTGLVGTLYTERTREWWSRLNASLTTAALVWLLWMGLTFYVPPGVAWASAQLPGWASTTLGSAWVGALLSALFGRVRGESTPRTQRWVTMALNVCAWLVVAGFLVLLSVGLDRALAAAAKVAPPNPDKIAPETAVRVELSGAHAATATVSWPEDRATPWRAYFARANERYEGELTTTVGDSSLRQLDLALLFTIVALALFGRRVDVNKFSLHNMYKLRLVRCYLGASNPERKPHPFTGFDEDDDLPLSDLRTAGKEGALQRPIQLINVTLNLTQGRNLAWQERKAAGFVFSPFACGFALSAAVGQRTAPDGVSGPEVPGYCDTAVYALDDSDDKGFSLGMAMATSGAAVSPNMGLHSSPARAFLLTIFNLRLGRWSPNPANRSVWRRPGPRFALICLLQELFGFSNDERDFIYLSDGGHFDNMGLYELVRRRCNVIVLSDATADPELQFRDLGDSIRKCRVDFGIDIDLSLAALRTTANPPVPLLGHAIANIRYDPNDAKKDGKLVVLRPSRSVIQDEPADVSSYSARNPQFPHQSTADQFFDESQFESYRALGKKTTLKMLDEYAELIPPTDLPASALPPKRTQQPRRYHRLRVLMKLAGLLVLILVGLALWQQLNEWMVHRAWGVLAFYSKAAWLFVDLGFAIAYTVLFFFAARYGASAVRRVAPLHRREVMRATVLGVLVLLLGAAFCLDAWENALLYSQVTYQAASPTNDAWASVAAVSAWKWYAVSATVGSLVLVGGSAIWFWRKFITLRRTRHHQGR